MIMKKIIVYIFCLLFANNLFAFEGVIKQELYDFETQSFQELKWIVKDQKVRLELSFEDGDLAIIPDLRSFQAYLFGVNPPEGAKKEYFKVPVESIKESNYNIKGKISSVIKYESIPVNYVELETGDKYEIVLKYLDFDFNSGIYASYFKEYTPFNMMAVSNIEGFPFECSLKTKEGEKLILKTKSVEQKVVSDDLFKAPPSGYTEYQVQIINE